LERNAEELRAGRGARRADETWGFVGRVYRGGRKEALRKRFL